MTEIAEAAVLRLASYARLHHDAVRDRWVLLAPERVLFPCPITVNILERMDGRNLGQIVDDLAGEFEAPRATIATDTAALLRDLVEQRLVLHA